MVAEAQGMSNTAVMAIISMWGLLRAERFIGLRRATVTSGLLAAGAPSSATVEHHLAIATNCIETPIHRVKGVDHGPRTQQHRSLRRHAGRKEGERMNEHMGRMALLVVLLGLCFGAQAAEKVTIYLTDALGSPAIEMDAHGDVTATAAYRPYGTQVRGTPKNGPGFTGHVDDVDTGLIYMQARYYDPSNGRFLSCDPVVPSPKNTFSVNRYDYANNNSIRNVDPNGRQSIGEELRAALAAEKAEEMAAEARAAEEAAASAAENSSGIVWIDPREPASMGRHPPSPQDEQNSKLASKGRSGRQARLRNLANDGKLGSSDRGWIKNEMRSIEQGKRANIRNPPGKDLAHERGREAAKGYSYKYSNIQDRDLHRTQHKYDNFGRANRERPVGGGQI